MKTLCAWCGVVMKDGRLPISHGCCQPCQVALLAAADPILSVERQIEDAAKARRQ